MRRRLRQALASLVLVACILSALTFDGMAKPAGLPLVKLMPAVGLPVSNLGQTAFGRYVAEQFLQMTTPSSSEFDPYLASRVHGRSLADLDIVTTVDPKLQRLGQEIVSDQVRTLRFVHVTDGALVSINLRPGCYGCVLSMVGTAKVDKTTVGINMANATRQPGSSFMPFTYLAAFERGLSPGTAVLDARLRVRDRSSPTGYYTPTNYDLKYHGLQSLRLSLGNSFNIPAVKVELYIKPRTVATTAVRLGISNLWKDNPQCCSYATTLGDMERGVTLLQETAAYGALATNGKRVIPISFKRIRDRATGTVLWRLPHDSFLRKERVRVAPAADAYMVTSILSDNAARTREYGPDSPLLLTHPAAAKAGTTNSFTDNSALGYVPQLVTGVWVGNVNYSPMVGSTVLTGAAPIWHDFMENASQILKLRSEGFSRPPRVAVGTRCKLANTSPRAYGSFSYGADLDRAKTTPYCTVPRVRGLD